MSLAISCSVSAELHNLDGNKIVDIQEFDRLYGDEIRILYVRDRDEHSAELLKNVRTN